MERAAWTDMSRSLQIGFLIQGPTIAIYWVNAFLVSFRGEQKNQKTEKTEKKLTEKTEPIKNANWTG